MLSLRRPTRLATVYSHGIRAASSQAKPKVLLLDPIALAHDELETLKSAADVVVRGDFQA
jgi:hypothetical protein